MCNYVFIVNHKSAFMYLWNYVLVYLRIEHLCAFIRLCICLLMY